MTSAQTLLFLTLRFLASLFVVRVVFSHAYVNATVTLYLCVLNEHSMCLCSASTCTMHHASFVLLPGQPWACGAPGFSLEEVSQGLPGAVFTIGKVGPKIWHRFNSALWMDAIPGMYTLRQQQLSDSTFRHVW